jgi:ABC-2 type transport system ATP-binding protein
MSKNIIETQRLTKKFGKIVAVDNLNLKIREGEIFGLLGPNGAGKTTTLLMLSTLIKPTSGTAKVNGFDILKNPDKVRESIGMVFQDPSSDDTLTGYENLKLHALLYNVPSSEIEDRIEKVLKLVDLTNRKNDLVKKYSGGMRRRLEIARGFLHTPKVLFLDEPTLGLDPQTREHIWQYIEKIVKEENMTIILTTHYMEEADRLCDRIAIIDRGKIVALGSPESLKTKLGGDLVKIKTKSHNVEKLRKMKFVKRLVKKNGEITLTVNRAGKNIQKILKVLGKVDFVEVRSPTLNDVFLHYTGRSIREEEGSQMEWIRSVMRARQPR